MKKYLGMWLLMVTIFSYSQIKISGIVKDSIGNPLEMANVIAMNTTDNSLEGYSITDKNGFYKIKISKPTTIQLKVSYLGFESQNKVLVIGEQETIKNFVLKEMDNSLDAVEITYEMPVTIKGDTIVYNADSFTSGKEKKLGDVLKKLPGVEVNAQGEIEVEGKKVSKIMVEGKDFFDGDTKLATKNIPADAIKKIEVLKNYNEVSQMKGLGDDSNNIAINIKLKEGKKNFWFGEVSAGIGEGDTKTRYLAHPKLFYYSPKKSINVITDINNIGEIPFTFQDYFKFSGGFKNMMKNGGISISSNSLGLSFLKNNKAKEMANKFAAINFSQSINKYVDFTGFAIFSGAENELEINNTLTILSSNVTENTQNRTSQNNNLGLLKLSLAYKPNVNFQMDYDVITKFSNLSESNYTNSFSSVSNGDIVRSKKEEKPFSIHQNVNMYYTLNDKNIFSYSGQYLYKKNNPLYNSTSSHFGFSEINVITQPKYDITQNKESTTSQLLSTLDYYYILNKKSNLKFTFGTVLNSQIYKSSIFQTLENNSVFTFNNEDLTNNVKFNFTDIYLGVHYKLKMGVFTITPGVTAHQYISKNRQVGIVTTKLPFYFLPDFNAKIAIKRSENIRLNYSISTSFTDVNKLSEGIIFNSYRFLTHGNRELNNALYHKYSIRYSNFNRFSFTNIHGSVNYIKKRDAIKGVYSQSLNIYRQNSYFNNLEIEDDLSVKLSVSKRFGKLKAKISGNLSIANTNRLTAISTKLVSKKSISKSQNYTASVSTNFNDWPNFELGYKTSINELDSFTSVSHKPYGNIEIGFFNDFILTSDYSFNKFIDSSNNTNIYNFLNANLYYQKEGSLWEFKASVINLLDTKSINDDYFSIESISTSKYIVQPRYFMLAITYDL